MGAPISRTRGDKRRALGMLRYYAGLATAIHGETIENSLPGEYLLLHAEGAGRRRRRDHPVERPARRLDLEDRPGARDRLHGRAEAGRGGAADAAAARRALPGGRRAAGRRQRRARLRRDRRRRAGRAPGRRQGRLHRLAPDRPEDRPASAGNLKRVSLELGGKSPDIVFADADLDAAVPGAAMAVFANSGQICSAGTRLFVERKVYDEFVGRVADFGKTLQVGNGLDPETQIGPLVSERAARARDRLSRRSAGRKARGAVRRRAADRRRAGEGLLRAADGVRRRARRHADRPGGDLRAGDLGDPVHRHRGGDRARQRDDLRSRQRRLDARRQQGAPARQGASAPARSGSTATRRWTRRCRSAATR